MDQKLAATQPEMHLGTCAGCGKTLEPSRPWQRFCSPQCRNDFHNGRRRGQETESPPSVAADKAGVHVQHQRSNAAILAQKQTKLKRVLSELARGTSLHRFQAERIGDHTLHSTVCKIQEYGIRVEREWITVPGYGGHPTRVCRYWLDAENAERACALLGWEPCRQDR